MSNTTTGTPQDGDSLRYVASQYVASTILIPCAVGWILQIFLAGVSTLRAHAALRRPYAIPFAKPALRAVVFCNLLSACCVFWDITAWMAVQGRTTADLQNFKLPDVINPIPAALTSVLTQCFMGFRCWRLIDRNLVFAATICLGALAVVGSAVWAVVDNYLYMVGKVDPRTIFAPTQAVLWSNAAVDIMITTVLTYNLRLRRNNDTGKKLQYLTDSLIRLAFETCAAPLAATIFTAVVYCSTYKDVLWWNLVSATIPFIPSLYVLSLVYCLEASHVRIVHNARIVAPATTTARGPEARRDLSAEHVHDSFSKGLEDEMLTSGSLAVSRVPDAYFSSWAPPQEWQTVGGDGVEGAEEQLSEREKQAVWHEEQPASRPPLGRRRTS